MTAESDKHIARLDQQELADLPLQWTNAERGHYLRRLLRAKGVDPDRLYALTYHPRKRCWLLSQPRVASGPPAPAVQAGPPSEADEAFYLRALTELRRSALAALASGAAQASLPLGARYELPAQPQETTPAALAKWLGEGGVSDRPVRFDSEGGWRAGLSEI
jgi:hypothetical protein